MPVSDSCLCLVFSVDRRIRLVFVGLESGEVVEEEIDFYHLEEQSKEKLAATPSLSGWIGV